MMKPLKISLFIFVCLGVLYGVTFLSNVHHKDAVTTQEGFAVFNTVIKYPTTDTFLMHSAVSETKTEQIDSIVDNIGKMVKVFEERAEKVDKKVKIDKDSLLASLAPVKVIPDFSNIDTSKIERIVYPESAPDFVKDLKKKLESGSCRIIHYGDSQLEGDRISAYVRNRLQGMYGGGGPGFVPVKQAYHQLKAKVIPSDNWLRYAVFDPTKDRFEHKKYGIFASLSRFTEPLNKPLDSISLDTIPVSEATIDIGYQSMMYSRLKKFSKVRLHYGNALVPVSIKVYNDDVLIKEDNLKADGKYHMFEIPVSPAPINMRIELKSQISPDFYGLTFDNDSGIILDNVAMRGASGTDFVKMDSGNFKEMAGVLKPGIFIFQYGGNTIPYLKDTLAVQKYAKYVMSNVNWVKKKAPKAKVIFIGPTDMSTRENGEYITYKLLPVLNDAFREACLANNIAYWSMFDAMGGRNSMQHWVDQGLAQDDYTHFSIKGTKVISELFFTSLYLDLMKTE